MKTTIRPLRNLFNRSPLRAFLLIPFVLVCLGLSPQARAVCEEGCDTSTFSTLLGNDALVNNTGLFNTAIGDHALTSNTFGGDNTATGYFSLSSNTTGGGNTATGYLSLSSNTTGSGNTATGSDALLNNTTGLFNTTIGYQALATNSTGSDNTANGATALVFNTTGDNNTATGAGALFNNTTGNSNTATGRDALSNNTTGSSNIAFGFQAGQNLTTGNSNINIGNAGFAGESKTIRLGTKQTHRTTFIAGISGATVPTGVAVIVDGSGHLGTTTSSERFKDAVKPMDNASEAILALKPVTFHYKQEIDPDGIPQFGLVAEEVEKVNPDLVARDADGKAYTVRYEAVNAMLLNKFLKEHAKVREQEAMITELKSAAARQEANAAHQQKQIEALGAGLQKMNAQLEMSRPVAHTVVDNP